MNTDLLKSKSLSENNAYIFFIFQTHYGYMGKWGVQILYWINSIFFFSSFMVLVDENIPAPVFVGLMGQMVLFAIWPINQFFAIPNKIKRYNLKVYEELLNS